MNPHQEKLVLRKIRMEDCTIISEAFAKQGWNKPVEQYHRYFQYQESGERDIVIAEYDREFAGYLTIQWQSGYEPFLNKKIPEIVDFNVLKKFQRQRIGTVLMDNAENRIKKVSSQAGIGVGITPDYGAAQILYAKRNYIPDGRGLCIDSHSVNYGDNIIVNDDLVMHMIKDLEIRSEENSSNVL